MSTHWHSVSLTAMFSTYLLGLVPGLLLGGPASDRHGRRRVVRCALALGAAASAALAPACSCSAPSAVCRRPRRPGGRPSPPARRPAAPDGGGPPPVPVGGPSGYPRRLRRRHHGLRRAATPGGRPRPRPRPAVQRPGGR
ncbi:hypothetical protein [Streptomyces sp. WMMC897]|uniref:hypothetical protein n=1 Tax=Streptomyces sp. WMMC897 TaxID=3014782 RepID=UPI002FC2F49E